MQKRYLLRIMRCQDDINTEHNMKSIGRAAVAQWTKRLTRNGQMRVRIREAHIFDITRYSVYRYSDITLYEYIIHEIEEKSIFYCVLYPYLQYYLYSFLYYCQQTE